MPKWMITKQEQGEHLRGYCTLFQAIAYDGGELNVRQRIADTSEGYREGQERARLIVLSVNSHAALVEALRACIDNSMEWENGVVVKLSHSEFAGIERALALAEEHV